MTPDVPDLSTKNKLLFLITTLSPRAKDLVETESYREFTSQDMSDEQHVLECALVELFVDLKEIGVILTDWDYDGITDHPDQLGEFLHLVQFLLPNSLYPFLKADSSLRTMLDHLLKGSLGVGETLIQTYLSELGGLDGQDALHPELTPIIEAYYPHLTQTETFTDYLTNLSDLLITEKIAVESDVQAHDLYRDVTRKLIACLSDAVNLYEDSPLYSRLCVMQHWVVKDLTSHSNFHHYHYLFTNTIATLPEDLIDSFNKAWYEYRVSHSWCVDYYPVRNIKVDETTFTMIKCFLHALFPEQKEQYVLAVQHASDQLKYPLPSTDFIISLYDVYGDPS